MVDSVQNRGWPPQRRDRSENRKTVLDALRKDGPAGRTELVRRTGLSRGTIIARLAELTEEGLARPVPGHRGHKVYDVASGPGWQIRDHRFVELDLRASLSFRGELALRHYIAAEDRWVDLGVVG